MEYTARLDAPPGISHGGYAGNRNGGIRTSDQVKVWKAYAALELRKQGWKPLPKGKYALRMVFDLYTWRSDIDKGDKFLIDALAKALGVNDYWVKERTTRAHPCRKGDDYVTVAVTIGPR